MSRTNEKVRSSMVTNVPGSSTLNTIELLLLELDPSQRLRVDDPGDRPDLVDDDLAEHVEVVGLDLRDQIILAEQRMELHDLLDLEELVVHLVLLRRSRGDEHETDGHPGSPVGAGTRLPMIKLSTRMEGRGQNESNLRARATVFSHVGMAVWVPRASRAKLATALPRRPH